MIMHMADDFWGHTCKISSQLEEGFLHNVYFNPASTIFSC
uniref:Uncharacterized protein n=1 Tax=Romanomermis culicivorax TaxID=13658 RepID=A0A915JNF4_ROMCU